MEMILDKTFVNHIIYNYTVVLVYILVQMLKLKTHQYYDILIASACTCC